MLVRGLELRRPTRSLVTMALAATCFLGVGFSDARADDARRTATIGNPSGPPIASMCGPDAVAVGLRVSTESRGYVAGVASLCENLSGAVSAAPAIVASPGWPTGDSWCVLRDVANGIHGRAGDIVDAVGVGCRDRDDGAAVGGGGGASSGPLDCPPGMVLRGVEGTVAGYFGRSVVHSVTGVCGTSLGNSAGAERCQQNGWQALAGSDGMIFASEDECVGHVAEGGALIDRASLLQCQQHLVDAGLTAPAEVAYLVGTPGNDDLSRVSSGIDVICGFAGNDRVDSLAGGDVFLGGADIDVVGRMSGGTFTGGPGVDIVDTMTGGTFDGGADTDRVDSMSGGTFHGGDSNDRVRFMSGGTFKGGDDDDGMVFMYGGTFHGGAGDDGIVEEMDSGTFDGGAGHDLVVQMYSGTFDGGAGDDSVDVNFGGTFNGDTGDDSVDVNFGGTFNGSTGDDLVVEMYRGTFNGSTGDDLVVEMHRGTFNGGAGDDRVGDKYGGTCTDVLNC